MNADPSEKQLKQVWPARCEAQLGTSRGYRRATNSGSFVVNNIIDRLWRAPKFPVQRKVGCVPLSKLKTDYPFPLGNGCNL